MNFITIDFETANRNKDSACAVGLVRFVNGVPKDSFYSLIKPPTLFFLPEFTLIHGITAKDVQNEATFAELWEKILHFLQGGDDNSSGSTDIFPFAAHNSGFDMSVLRAVLEHYELSAPKMQSVCSLRISQRVWPHFSYHKLPLLAKRFGIQYNAHNALDDALVCGKIICLAAKEKDVSTLDALLKTSGVMAKPL